MEKKRSTEWQQTKELGYNTQTRNNNNNNNHHSEHLNTMLQLENGW